MSKQEKKWQAENDADILRRYVDIHADSKRKKAAENVIRDEIKKSQKVLEQPVNKSTAGKGKKK